MDCRAFEEWLDRRDAKEAIGAQPEDLAAERHAAECVACEAAARDSRELTDVLGQRFAVAPDGFADAVMNRLPARSEQVRIPEDPESPWPWWIEILFEPAAALGLVLGVLYAVFAPTLLANGSDALPVLLARLTTLGSLPAAQWLDNPTGAIAVVATLCVAMRGLFRGSVLLFDRLTSLRPR